MILGLPSQSQVKLVDAFKTDRVILILARMLWSTWAQFSTLIQLNHPAIFYFIYSYPNSSWQSQRTP